MQYGSHLSEGSHSIRGGCQKFGTLVKISARDEVGCLGLVRPEDRRFKEMADPIYCGMNRAVYWQHEKGKGRGPLQHSDWHSN